MSIIQALRQLGADTGATVDNLNYGGCGVYARHVTRALQALGINARGRIVSYSHRDLDQVRAMYGMVGREAWRGSGFHISHVVVEFEHDGKTWRHDSTLTAEADILDKWDGDGGRGPLLPGVLTLAELEDMTNDRTDWNPSFWWGDCFRIAALVDSFLESNQRQAA